MEGFEDLGEYGRTNKIGNHVLVFLVRDLKENWKQPIAYFISKGPMKADSMKPFLLDCIRHCSEAGLLIKRVTSDQGTNNQR